LHLVIECLQNPAKRGAALVAVILCLTPGFAVAQTRAFQKAPGKLEMRLNSSHPVIRSGAPFALELLFESTFADLIEGTLELTFIDDDRIQMRFVTNPIVIPADAKTTFRVQLPSMKSLRTPTEFQVYVVLDSTRRTFDLGSHDILIPLGGMRQFVIAAPGLNEVDVGALTRRLTMDEFRPQKLNRQNFATFPVDFDPHRLLGDPIALYPYDVLVFVGKYFSSLSPRQLETLSHWTESGGGLVIVPTGALSDAHCRFLATLIGTEPAKLQTDALGRLPQLGPQNPEWLTACRFGFGRALVLRSIPQFKANASSAVSRSEWIRAAGFLWNARSAQVESIVQTGSWTIPAPPPPKPAPRQQNPLLPAAPKAGSPFATTDLRYTSYGDVGGLKPEEPAAADKLRDLLFPADVRVVPFGIVVGILASFLVVVAPLDYLLLGFLRRRRYTWVVFPCVSLAFTAVTVGVAGYYSGNTDHRGSLVIVDLGHDGRALRTSQIVHVITADSHKVTADIRDGLFAKTDVQPMQPNEAPGRDPLDERPVRLDEGIVYEGLLPSAFRVTWPSRQWSPAMHRLTRAASDVEVPTLDQRNFDWAAVDRLDLATVEGRRQATERFRRALPDCSILFANYKTEVAVGFPATSQQRNDRFQDWPAVLASLGRRNDHSLLAILFAVSPNGAGDLEDLAVLDEADPATWLVHVAVIRDKDLIVFRHVARKRSESASPLRPRDEDAHR
jgi:hypothetical protein